jgi:hypothetical protein
MIVQRCPYCGGDASEPDHRAHCDGRQGMIEDADLPLFARHGDPETSHAAMAAYDRERLRSGIAHAVALHRTRGPMADYEYLDVWRATWHEPCCDHLYRQARSAARDRGLIRDSGLRRVNPTTKRQQIIWEACEDGAQTIDRCPTCGSVRRRLPVAS